MRRFAFALAVAAVPFAVTAQTAPQQPPTPSEPIVIQPTQLGTALQQPQTAATQTTPAGGLGEHLKEATPDHPLEMGEDFGDCVSAMAVEGPCEMM